MSYLDASGEERGEDWYKVYDSRYQEPTAVFAGPKSSCEVFMKAHPIPDALSLELWP